MRYSVSIWIQYAYSVSISLEEPIEGQTNIFLFFKLFFTFFKEIVYMYVHTRVDHSFLRKNLFPHRKVTGLQVSKPTTEPARGFALRDCYTRVRMTVRIPGL